MIPTAPYEFQGGGPAPASSVSFPMLIMAAISVVILILAVLT